MAENTAKIEFNPDICIGCLACVFACRMSHNGKSHINYYKIDSQVFIPNPCRNCVNAACVLVCPSECLSKGPNGRIIKNYDACLSCGNCEIACPFGAVSHDTAMEYHICDQCGSGGEACIQTCPSGALQLKKISNEQKCVIS